MPAHDPNAQPPEWHDADWCRLLRERVAELGSRRVADALGYSPATVHTVANGTYGADPARVARRVVEVYGSEEVPCPVLGVIPLSTCAGHRARPFRATNPQAVRLFRACRACPHNPDAPQTDA